MNKSASNLAKIRHRLDKERFTKEELFRRYSEMGKKGAKKRWENERKKLSTL